VARVPVSDWRCHFKLSPKFLQRIFIVNDLPVRLTGLGASLAINAHQTLKLLALRTVIKVNYDPLCELGRELRFVAGNNILEELELNLVVYTFALPIESEDWSAFDSVLTEFGAFPVLHRVSFSLEILGRRWDDVDVEDGIGKTLLLKDKFPRLAESKAVEFNFSVDKTFF
jgi:hypothetical protein